MSNTVITNYTDLNGPSSKADSSVVVIVNKDGSLSVDQNLLGTLMGTDGSQSAGISVVRVGHEGRPDDPTDSESEDDKVPHVTLTVDSYYNEPNTIIKYDSGAEMLQSLRIETRENSLLGFQNDHCYTPLTSPSQVVPQRNESYTTFDEPIIEISHTPPPKPVPSAKKITILEQKIIPKGKKLHINTPESPVILKGNEALSKPLPVKTPREIKEIEKELKQAQESSEESTESSSSGESILDRDSDSDYTDRREPSSTKSKKPKAKARILQPASLPKSRRAEAKVSKSKLTQQIVKREIKENKNQAKLLLQPKENKTQIQPKAFHQPENDESSVDLESLLPTSKIAVNNPPAPEFNKVVVKQPSKAVKKEKKAPAHPALLTDMTALFSTPDVIRRISTDNKTPGKPEKDVFSGDKQSAGTSKSQEIDGKAPDTKKQLHQTKLVLAKTYDGLKRDKNVNPIEKVSKGYDLIPHLDDASLAQILQDTTSISSNNVKNMITPTSMVSPGLVGPLSPTLDLLGGLPPEEDLSEDLLMHVAQLVESSENLQEVIDKQVLGKVDTVPTKTSLQSPFQQAHASNLYTQSVTKIVQKTVQPSKQPIEIVRRDGRVITLPPIEAPATRSSKRKSQVTSEVAVTTTEPPLPMVSAPVPIVQASVTPELQISQASVSKQYINKKLISKGQEAQFKQNPVVDKISAESQESWNSEDDPNRLWCICKQPHNNRFMICCDGCEDWFHGKCVNITKAMGQQMEEQGVEWRCPNCIRKTKTPMQKSVPKTSQKKQEIVLDMPDEMARTPLASASKTGCIVCKKSARASSIYCSDACILKHAQDSLSSQDTPTRSDAEPGKPQEKKSDSRVIVYERKSGRLLAGPNAPTAENLKTWLQKNPTFEVVRPGALSSIRPGTSKKKHAADSSPKIQTTLNFARVPRKSQEHVTPSRSQPSEGRERRVLPPPREEKPQTPKTPNTSNKSHLLQLVETPKPSTSTAKPTIEPRKIVRSSLNRSQSNEKPSPSPSSRRKDSTASKMSAPELDIRENVRKSLQEQMSLRMAEKKKTKLTEEDIQEFAEDTEIELHELFRDTGMKYKAKYRSLMFNIKDRKNLTLWEKICSKSITPKQLVRLSPEELASQELAEWRDQESKYQLELIKKSELDLLAASKTYVLKTHKGEEVMETKEATELELDPNVPVEDVVTAMNDSTVGEAVTREVLEEGKSKTEEKSTKKESRKRERDSSTSRAKRSRRDSRRDSDRKSQRSRIKSEVKERKEWREQRRRSSRRAEKESRARSSSRHVSKTFSKTPDSKEKAESNERPKHRSRSKAEGKKRSKSRDYSRSASKGRERSRSRRRSDSREDARRHRSRSKQSRSDDSSIHRSKSQENYVKNKTDSTDSDSIERPKSAMLKEPHPEYDPHEPMITSAFSEEDLRKADDAYEDTYKSDIVVTGGDYDPTKSFTLDTNIILPAATFSPHQDKPEVESDQEPSSTVENAAATVWNGCINMVDVARFYVAAHEVSGSAIDLEEDLSTELDIVGRINPDTVWDYISKTKKTSNKDIVILRLQAANDEEKMQYIALYSYLSSRNRLGVVKVPNTATVKDFYIVPLAANSSLQSVLLPLDGPGLGDVKTHLLIAVIIRQRRKRLPHHIPKDIIPAKVSRISRKRSYTPPPPGSPRRRALPLPAAFTSTVLSTSVKDKIAASLANADMDEAYSPGSSNSSGGGLGPTPAVIAPPATANLRSKMEELNRQIEEQKQQIMKMAQADSSVTGEDDEAYSPSRPMTPPTVPPTTGRLADIDIPSNLHEILATIKQRSEASNDVDMRSPPVP